MRLLFGAILFYETSLEWRRRGRTNQQKPHVSSRWLSSREECRWARNFVDPALRAISTLKMWTYASRLLCFMRRDVRFGFKKIGKWRQPGFSLQSGAIPSFSFLTINGSDRSCWLLIESHKTKASSITTSFLLFSHLKTRNIIFYHGSYQTNRS